MALTVADARALDRAAQIPLVTMELMDATVIRMSDRAITLDGHQYEPLVESFELVEENVSRLDSRALNADFTMKLKNAEAFVEAADGEPSQAYVGQRPETTDPATTCKIVSFLANSAKLYSSAYDTPGQFTMEDPMTPDAYIGKTLDVIAVVDGSREYQFMGTAIVTDNTDYVLSFSPAITFNSLTYAPIAIIGDPRDPFVENALVGRTLQISQATLYTTEEVEITANTPDGTLTFTPEVAALPYVAPIYTILSPTPTHYVSLVEVHDLHPFNGAKVSVSCVFEDNGQRTDPVAIFTGIAEEPQNITKASLTLRCSGVPEYKAKAFALAKMFAADFPCCLPSDSGKAFPYLIGQFKTIECIRTRWPVYETDNYTTLTTTIDSDDTTIECGSSVGFGDDRDEEKVIWIEGERITWDTKDITSTPNHFSGCVRGTAGGTAAAAHTAGAIIAEFPEEYAPRTVRLSAAMNSTQTYFDVGDVGGFGAGDLVAWIGNERVTYTAIAGRRFTGCTRGTGGTSAAAHAKRSVVTEFANPGSSATVVAAAHDLVSIDTLYGEFGDLLAPIASFSPKYVNGRYEIEIPKSSLVVPQTLLDNIAVSGGGSAPATDTVAADNDGLTTSAASVTKTFTWPANPYLDGNGDPEYTQARLKIEFVISQEAFVQWPTNVSGDQMRNSYLRWKWATEANSAYRLLWSGETFYDWFNGWASYTNRYMLGVGSPHYVEVTDQLNWGRSMTLWWSTESLSLFNADCNVSWVCLLNANAVVKTGTVKDEKYFRRIYASGYGIPAESTLFGTVGAAITRPDLVMKKWIVDKLGFLEADIDATTFDDAGTFYAAQSPEYALSPRVTGDVDPLDRLYKMAFESRSIVYFAGGKWYLKVIPDTAPASVRTISADDLAGEKSEFVCGYTKRDDVKNALVLKWDRNDGPTTDKDQYRKSAEVSLVTGNYPTLSEDLALDMVYGDAQAMDVALIYLAQRNRVVKTLSFPVFWDNTDLQIGDTITPTGMGWWEGVKFWIHSARREGAVKATLDAVEWWE